MSAQHDYTFRMVRVGKDGRSAREITYTALPLEDRSALERAWADAHGLKHWSVLEPRLITDAAVPADELRRIARAMLEDVADVWCGVGAELAVIIRHTLGASSARIVERATVAKTDERKARERIARKLGKGAKLGRRTIMLEGYASGLRSAADADRFVRSRLSADELRTVKVTWHDRSWDQFDNVRNLYHTVYADAEHYLADGVHRPILSGREWATVRGTLDPVVLELVEGLAQGWHGTGSELLEAARALAQ